MTLSDGTQLDADAEYLVASNDYVMAGGDDYSILADIETEGRHGLVYDALFDRFASIGVITWNTDGRLTDLSALR